MKIVIVDDEQKAIEALVSLLKVFGNDADVVGTAKSIADAELLLRKVNPDILFLDIELRDGLGIELLDRFPNRSFKTVFVTAYDQYAIQAFKLRAFDYILKPIDPDDLESVLHNLRQSLSNESSPDKIDIHRISVPTQHGIRIIDIEDIIRLQSDNNYTKIFLKNEKPVLISKTLKKFEESLIKNTFIRIHQRHIVNFDRVVEYTKKDGGFLILDNGDEIPVSNKNKSFVEKMIQYGILSI
jgi:two-component system LytT family response regulator